MPNSKSSAAQPTNGFSLETGHHLRVNKQAFQQHKIYCQEALYNKETHVFLLFVQGKFISYRFLKCFLLKTNQKMIPELILLQIKQGQNSQICLGHLLLHLCCTLVSVCEN